MIAFPKSTLVGKPVPKTAFYRHFDIRPALKTRFVEDVERIVWTAKLAPSTLSIEDGAQVHEIVVFTVRLKAADVPDDVFLAIDRQMPRHVFFILQYGDRLRLLLNYKEHDERSKIPFRIVKTFRTVWMSPEQIALNLQGTSMDNLYEAIAGQVSGFGTTNAADTRRIIALREQIERKQREAEQLQKKVRSERQFVRQMQLNSQARAIKKEIVSLQKELDSYDNR